jgi:Protein of unknown function (DUF2946)
VANRDTLPVAVYFTLTGETKPPARSRQVPGQVISCSPDGFAMRRRLKNFLPIVLIALAVQIFAPIGACWAAAFATSDPLATAVICHGNNGSTPGQADQTGHRAHDGCCSVCSVLQTGAPLDGPEAAVVAIERPSRRVVWHGFAAGFTGARAGSSAQARAPPHLT